MTTKTRRSKAQKNPTVKDVSRLAGVSTATVSRVLAGLDGVSAEARQRVLDAVKPSTTSPMRAPAHPRTALSAELHNDNARA